MVSLYLYIQAIIPPEKILKIKHLFDTVDEIFILMRQNVYCQILFVIYFLSFEISQFIPPGMNFENKQAVINCDLQF